MVNYDTNKVRNLKYKNITKNALGFDDSNLVYGENTPIKTKNLPYLPNSKIKIPFVTSELTDEINNYAKNNNEIGFVLFGREGISNQVDIIGDLIVNTENQQSFVAEYNQEQTKAIENFINESVKNKKSGVIFIGHTHPKIGYPENYNNFSFGDLKGYVEFSDTVKNLVEEAKKRFNSYGDFEISTAGCLLVDGNYNFIFYDKNYKNFYKFQNVEVYKNNQFQKSLPSYSHDKANNLRRFFDRGID